MKPRSATDSPVPIDVFTGDQFNAGGNSADITDNLKNLVPSFTATPATGDGSAFIRPTSLRGLSPDQTLVLVNGKRRHRTSLVQFFAPAAGNGSHGVDIAMIPGIALKRIEVLRDGAAAQYGSDAIAGVMNFVLNDANEGGEVTAQYGKFYDGEQSYKIAANVGLPLGDTGFVNISAEYNDNEALSRGIQQAAAQGLINAGVQGVGDDSPFDDGLAQTWGRPETSGARLFINSGFEIADGVDFYLHGNYAETDGRYRFFYRNGFVEGAVNTVSGGAITPHSTLAPLVALGLTGSIVQTGYTPFLDGAQKDYSAVGGVKGETSGGLFYDFSVGYGKNELAYFLNNTINSSLGLDASGNIPQMDFDMGGYEQAEININADFSYALNDSLNLAFGAEWREEEFTTVAGEASASVGAGTSGMSAVTPADAGAFSRNNYAVYVDIEHDVSDDFMLQYAARYEDFSDFGSTINGKLAARYNLSEAVTLRAAISTGFHAPTPGQANVSTIITTFDGVSGLLVEEGLVPATSDAAIAAGGQELTEEKSVNFSLGFTASIGDATTLTVDAYRIEIDDRIYRASDIRPEDDLSTPEVEGPTISFYTNALDVVSEGIDVVLTSSADWSDDNTTDFSFAASYNKVSAEAKPIANGLTPVSASVIEDIENNYPNFRFVASANTHFGPDWNVLLRANFYGSHYDERGTIGAASQPSAKIDGIVNFDLEVGYQVNDNLRLVAGAVNILDTFIDEIGLENANRVANGLQYPRRTPANYEGGSVYVKASYKF
ncbi:MAG: TonB-dependent receptor [Oleibacter sp.]|nr:TonB-dependent receptor [Thalassolituus sp.]